MNNFSSFGIKFNKLVTDDRSQLLSILISQLRDIELAEDVLQNALIKAWSNWQTHGIPKNPKSWLLKTAYNQAIDIIRRQQNFNNKRDQITQLHRLMHQLNTSKDDQLIPDERLKLIFTCCHPALDQHTQVALTLSTICGFSTEQVAQVFLLKVPAMAQRLVRAKRKIKRSVIPYKTPNQNDLNDRLQSVLEVIYLIYNQGYYAADNPSLMEHNHSDEAIYLATTLNTLLPNQAELLGLLALMHFHFARFTARSQKPGCIISLEHQNRRLWNQASIDQANDWFAQATALKSIGPYQIQAAISGVHSQALKFADTDWEQIVLLYSKLHHYLPIATVKINQAVAMTFNNQASQALKILEHIEHHQLADYLPFYLAKAHAMKALGQKAEAANNVSLAIALSNNSQEKAFLQNQIELINH